MITKEKLRMKQTTQWLAIGLLVALGASSLFGQQVKMSSSYGSKGCYSNCTPPPPSVPEPGTYMLMGGGLAALAIIRRKRA